MASSWIPSWSPVNSFPNYHGPYDVGTVDVELPVADLPEPCAVPNDAPPTIAFRMFYPCVKPKSHETSRPVRWIPQPQRINNAALMRFLGMGQRGAGTASYLLQHLHWINIRAYRNAKLSDPPTSNGRWPVTMFSHGLAGSRNAYSYICGNLASYGTIVIALDHRDGSSPVQYVRATAETDAYVVDTVKISHEPRQEVFEARDKQLRIRLWEISTVFEALMKIDAGQEVENLDKNTSHRRKDRVEVLHQFENMLDVHQAGKVTFAGHSFGAATVTQLLKSVYYSNQRPQNAGRPLITPSADAAILHQILPDSPLTLLDLWCLPLKSPDQTYLWDRALPSYSPNGPQGSNVLAILSEGFHNWKANFDATQHVITSPAVAQQSSALSRAAHEKGKLLPPWSRLQDQSPSRDSGYSSTASRSPTRSGNGSGDGEARDSSSKLAGPHMFYVEHSQHFSQSDFGVLFPYITRRLAKAEEPERILELNTRAMVQLVRNAGIEVGLEDNAEILNRRGDVRSWRPIPVEGGQQVNVDDRVHETVD